MNDMQSLMAKLDVDGTPVTIKTSDGEVHKGVLAGTCRDYVALSIGDKRVEYIVAGHIVTVSPTLQEVA